MAVKQHFQAETSECEPGTSQLWVAPNVKDRLDQDPRAVDLLVVALVAPRMVVGGRAAWLVDDTWRQQAFGACRAMPRSLCAASQKLTR